MRRLLLSFLFVFACAGPPAFAGAGLSTLIDHTAEAAHAVTADPVLAHADTLSTSVADQAGCHGLAADNGLRSAGAERMVVIGAACVGATAAGAGLLAARYARWRC